MSASKAPLNGVRILDLTRVLSGPYCTLTLGDLGAEIIKIEEPTKGDDVRSMHISEKHKISSYFLGLNRNKKSVAIDIRTPEGKDIILELAQKSDIIVENFSAGVMDRNGLGYDIISKTNPAVVYCAISGYGRTGPDRDRPGYDPVVQAESGLMSLTGEPDGDGMRTGVAMVDIITGLFASEAILAALYERERSGKGQFIDVPLFDTAINMLNHAAMAFLLDGRIIDRVGNSNQTAMPVGVYHAADGAFSLAMTNDRLFNKFCEEVLKRPEMAKNPDYRDNSSRVKNRVQLEAVLGEIFATNRCDYWLERCAKADIPAGPIRDVSEALTSPEVARRKLITYTEHSSAGRIAQVRSPMHLSRTPIVTPTAAPLLGENTAEVLRNLLGYDTETVAWLRQTGAIR